MSLNFQWRCTNRDTPEDLSDDCYIEVDGYLGRAERMGTVLFGDTPYPGEDTPETPTDRDYWWACVYRGNEEVWSTNELGGYYFGSAQIRMHVEWVIRALVAESRVKVLAPG